MQLFFPAFSKKDTPPETASFCGLAKLLCAGLGGKKSFTYSSYRPQSRVVVANNATVESWLIKLPFYLIWFPPREGSLLFGTAR